MYMYVYIHVRYNVKNLQSSQRSEVLGLQIWLTGEESESLCTSECLPRPALRVEMEETTSVVMSENRRECGEARFKPYFVGGAKDLVSITLCGDSLSTPQHMPPRPPPTFVCIILFLNCVRSCLADTLGWPHGNLPTSLAWYVSTT